jgi:hypothetical protein
MFRTTFNSIVLAALAGLALSACGISNPGDEPSPESNPIVSSTPDAGGSVPDAGVAAPDAGAEECTPGEYQSCGECVCEGEIYPDGGCSSPVCGGQECDNTGHWTACEGPNTPIVLAFNGEPVKLSETSGHFDLGQGAFATTLWPSANTPWLTRDRNGDGRINDGSELFGSMSRLSDGKLAKNGFEALADFDTNQDGVIDARDQVWHELALWFDYNGDRKVEAGETKSMAEAGIRSISLNYENDLRCDGLGNCEDERASFTWRDDHNCEHRGAAVDVHLASISIAVSER